MVLPLPYIDPTSHPTIHPSIVTTVPSSAGAGHGHPPPSPPPQHHLSVAPASVPLGSHGMSGTAVAGVSHFSKLRRINDAGLNQVRAVSRHGRA